MTETEKKAKTFKTYLEHYPCLGECQVRGESLKDGNLIVCSVRTIKNNNMFVVDVSKWCHNCGAIHFRPYNKALDGKI